MQSIIDSPHTRKEKREKIVALCENAQDIMKDILERQKNNKVSLYLYPQNSPYCQPYNSYNVSSKNLSPIDIFLYFHRLFG